MTSHPQKRPRQEEVARAVKHCKKMNFYNRDAAERSAFPAFVAPGTGDQQLHSCPTRYGAARAALLGDGRSDCAALKIKI